jgi:hypothetical protein
MEGNSVGHSTENIQYALRITFGIVHGVMLTLFSFGLALLFPSLSQFLFALFGCVVIPIISFLLTLFCNTCIEYISPEQSRSVDSLVPQSSTTVARILKTAWIPPLGVFCVNILILPLEMMPALGFTGPMNALIITSILMNFLLTIVLQVYAARNVQVDSFNSLGAEAPT